MQFNIGSIRLRERLKVFDSLGVTLPAVATEPEQHARLRVRRVGIQRALKGIDRCLEVPLLEFREAEVETYSRQLWIQCNRLAVCRRGLLVLLFLRKDNPQAGEGRSIVRMVLSHGLPDRRERFHCDPPELRFRRSTDAVGMHKYVNAHETSRER